MNSICTDIKSDATETNVGMILKEARQKHKVRDLNAIAEELCIKPHLLEALEQGDFASFPSSCYATGFLKNYASFLNLNTRDVVSRYEAEYAGSKECVVLSFPEAKKYSTIPVKQIAGIATLCIAIVVGIWAGFDNLDAEEVVSSVAATKLQTEVSVYEAVVTDKHNAAPETIAVKDDEVRLEAMEDVWVRLSETDGSVRVEKILNKGQGLVAPTDEGLSLMTNNAAALKVLVNGSDAKRLGVQGQIIENIKLEQQELVELSLLD